MKPLNARYSVIIPAYNASRTIEATLRSVMDQRLAEWEAVVVDDGSTDETAAIVQRLSVEDPRIRLVRQDNTGTAGALNTGGKHARAPFHAFLGADDFLLPEFLSAQDAFIAEHPGYDIYACNCWIQLPDGRRRLLWQGPRAERIHELTPEDQIAESSIVSMTVMSRRVWDLVGGFRPLHSEDYDFWLRALILGARHIYNPRVLSVYVRGEGTKTRALVKEAESFLSIQRAALTMPETTPAQRAALEEAIRFSEARLGRRRLEERLLARDYSRARRDYMRYRLAFTNRTQYLVGLAIMLVSPALYARIKASRMV